MPLTVNVGLSRKVTEDYNSRGFTLNIAAELPANLVEDPNGLAEATNNLFQLATDLLDDQVQQATGGTKPPARPDGRNGEQRPCPPQRPANGSRPGNGNGNGNGNGGGRGYRSGGNGHDAEREITQAQARAIQNMARRLKEDADAWASEQFGVPVRELTVKQGSQLIDQLKAAIESPEPAGATR